MWRPEKGWDNPHEDGNDPKHTCMRPETCDCDCHDAYEAGANAMMEALFEMAKESPTGTFVIDSKEVHIYEVAQSYLGGYHSSLWNLED